MFAPKFARPAKNAATHSTNKHAPERSLFGTPQLGGGGLEQARTLQKGVGNKATLQLLTPQPRNLTENAPHSHHEQAADPTCLTAPPAAKLSWDLTRLPLYSPDRKSRQPASFPLAAHPRQDIPHSKFVLGSADDPLEHEADHIARQVTAVPASAFPVSSGRPQLDSSRGVSGPIAERVQHLQGSGEPLNPVLQAHMEAGFRTDFSGVRVHTNREADRLNRALGARAFTSGNDIFVSAASGPRDSLMLGHELAHVVQQRSIGGSGAARLIQRDANSDDYKQGYQDGLSGGESHSVPRDGDALTDYDEGYAKGHYEFNQQTASGGPSGPNASQETAPAAAPQPGPNATQAQAPTTQSSANQTTATDAGRAAYQQGYSDGVQYHTSTTVGSQMYSSDKNLAHSYYQGVSDGSAAHPDTLRPAAAGEGPEGEQPEVEKPDEESPVTQFSGRYFYLKNIIARTQRDIAFGLRAETAWKNSGLSAGDVKEYKSLFETYGPADKDPVPPPSSFSLQESEPELEPEEAE